MSFILDCLGRALDCVVNSSLAIAGNLPTPVWVAVYFVIGLAVCASNQWFLESLLEEGKRGGFGIMTIVVCVIPVVLPGGFAWVVNTDAASKLPATGAEIAVAVGYIGMAFRSVWVLTHRPPPSASSGGHFSKGFSRSFLDSGRVRAQH